LSYLTSGGLTEEVATTKGSIALCWKWSRISRNEYLVACGVGRVVKARGCLYVGNNYLVKDRYTSSNRNARRGGQGLGWKRSFRIKEVCTHLDSRICCPIRLSDGIPSLLHHESLLNSPWSRRARRQFVHDPLKPAADDRHEMTLKVDHPDTLRHPLNPKYRVRYCAWFNKP
jgi:hypothetical protein